MRLIWKRKWKIRWNEKKIEKKIKEWLDYEKKKNKEKSSKNEKKNKKQNWNFKKMMKNGRSEFMAAKLWSFSRIRTETVLYLQFFLVFFMWFKFLSKNFCDGWLLCSRLF